MTTDTRIALPSLKEACSPQEWQTRVDLAACYRLVDAAAMADGVNTHISARIPGTEEFLINPYGWLFDEITASSLVKIDLEGRILARARDDLVINPAGYVIHSAIHAVRSDVACVLHTHTRAGGAVAALQCGLLPISQKALRFYSEITYHAYEGPAVDLAERERLQRDLGRSDVMILRNHGLLTCGATIAEAFNKMFSLDRACQVQLDAMATGSALEVPPQSVIDNTARLFDPQVRRPYGVMEWPAMLRLLNRRDPSYRD